jgi:hypothetical protein
MSSTGMPIFRPGRDPLVASAILLVGPMSVFKKLAANYRKSSHIDASECLLAITWPQLISLDFYDAVPTQFHDKIRFFHLWRDFMLVHLELTQTFTTLDMLGMGFLLQLEIICSDKPNAPCQQPGARACWKCKKYPTRTIGVSANGKVDKADHTDENDNFLTNDVILMNTALREVREEMSLHVDTSAFPPTQSLYRAGLTKLLTEMTNAPNIKVPDLYYDCAKTRLNILLVSQSDIAPMFPCSDPEPWKYQTAWDRCVATANPRSWSAAFGPGSAMILPAPSPEAWCSPCKY